MFGRKILHKTKYLMRKFTQNLVWIQAVNTFEGRINGITSYKIKLDGLYGQKDYIKIMKI